MMRSMTAVRTGPERMSEERQHGRRVDPPTSAAAAPLLRLQRSHGNRWVRDLLAASAPRAIQPKLKVSQPDDPYEQEAERVAQTVMSSSEDVRPATASAPQIQRMCAECEEEALHRSARAEAPDTASEPSGAEERVERARSGGEPLPVALREFFEPRFGADFSGVRIHRDGGAAESARELNARAYTIGRDIVFGAGEYAPDTRSGKALIAHELTHVVQQRGNYIQRLSVTGVGSLTTLTCGGYSRRWDFELATAAPEDGYIVQKVEFFINTADCSQPAVSGTPTTPNLTFWEAWPVSAGAKLHTAHAAAGYTDQSSTPSRPNTTGTVMANGTIKFFKKSVTGNLGNFTADGTWKRGGEPQSGSLPSTHTKPTWWDDTPTEGPASRSAQSAWSCCGPAASQFNIVLINP